MVDAVPPQRPTGGPPRRGFSDLEWALVNDFQREFPLSPTPFRDIAAVLGCTEEQVLCMLGTLHANGIISRVGPVIRPHTVGTSTLAAMAVPSDRLAEVAALVNGYPEVNHNYEREHHFNLWFVVTAQDHSNLNRVLQDIETHSGLSVMPLPLLEDYFIDLGFDLGEYQENGDAGTSS